MKCGFYERVITPPLGVSIPGYYGGRIADDVRTDLYAKALVLECEGKKVAIVALDIIWITEGLHNSICDRLEKMAGIPRDCVLVAATHIHTGASISLTARDCDPAPDPEYLYYTARIAADAVILAMKRMEEVTIDYGCEEVPNLAFIRNYRMKDGSIRTNPGCLNPDIVEPIGKADPRFPVMFFKNLRGELIGALSSFSCHHDTVAGTAYCADFSGALSDELKQIYGRQFVSVFLLGACGNVNHVNIAVPTSKRPSPLFRHMGEELAKAFVKAIQTAEPVSLNMLDSRKELVWIAKRKMDPERVARAKALLESGKPVDYSCSISNIDNDDFLLLEANEILAFEKVPDPIAMTVQVIRIGDCMIYALCGEIYVEWQHYLWEHSPTSRNLFSTVSNGPNSFYVPTKEMCGIKTLYEGHAPASQLVAEGLDILTDKCMELADELSDTENG